jgi:hypothetical protein
MECYWPRMAQMVLSHLLPVQAPLTEQPSAEPEEDMEKIPETFMLDEDDLMEAITDWLNANHCDDGYSHDFVITFKATEKRSPGKGLPGGMNDDIVTTVITAVATKDE